MSLLSAVLHEADKASTDDLKKLRTTLLPQVKEMTERIQLLSWALHQNFVDTYVNFTPTKSLEQLNYRNRKANIVNDYNNLLQNLNEFNDKLTTNDDEFSSCDAKLRKAYEILSDLCIAVEGKNILNKASHEFGRFNFSDALLSVKELQNQLKDLKLEGEAVKALSNIGAQAENQFALYAAHLSLEWEGIFTWSEKKGVQFLTYSLSVQQSDPELIQKVLKSLYVTDRFNAELGLFAHFFINKLLHNVIHHNCDIFTDEDIGALVFNVKIDLHDTKLPNYQTIFNNLMAIFEFLQSTLGLHFNTDRKFIAAFADLIREKFFYKIIEECIKNNLPACDSSYENYKNIVIELDCFNKFLIELNFVELDKSPLNKYINDTECILYNKKCDKLLSDVRVLLKQSLSLGTIQVGTRTDITNESILDVSNKELLWDLNKPLFLPPCVISQNVKQIMSLIVDHLEESVKLPEKYSYQLVTYINDIAVMYQCIIPKKFKINLECCPLDIALFFNNCFYLAHGLVGPPWKVTLPDFLSDQLATILLESIQNLRVVGLEKMSLYLQNKKNSIKKSIECVESPWTNDSYEQFDCAINSALTLMKDLKACWLNILPDRMYEKSLCTLTQALLQAVLDRIFSDTLPITENLVYIFAVRFESMVDEINGLFEEPIEHDTRIKAWNKFTKMPQLLKGQLLEISDLWNHNRKTLHSFTCEEIRQLIKMRFPDNKYRLRILKEIQ